MLAKTESVALIGADARLVRVEVHVPDTGLPTFRIVGLPAKSVREAEQRTRAALESTGLRWPPHRITANLAPGALPKEGTHFDLSIALGVLAGDKKIPTEPLTQWVIVGELGLDGSIRSVRGVLAAAIAVRRYGRRGLMCPASNASEAALVGGIEVVPVGSLKEAIDFVKGEGRPHPAVTGGPPAHASVTEDMGEVRGQTDAKEALEVAAAGGHNLLALGSVTPV